MSAPVALPGGILVVGFDPSLRNWGVSIGSLNMTTGLLTVLDALVIQPVLPTGKQVRQNSEDLEAAKQLCEGAVNAAQGAQAIFVECPVGSQSARAMASYGICVGVLGALRSIDIPFFEVTATEVKMTTVGKKTATKAEMIAWAVTAHPEAPWPTYMEKGVKKISEAKAEHIADATAAIYAGCAGNEFKQLLPFMKLAVNSKP